VHLHVLPRYDGDVAAFVGGIFAKPWQLLRGGASRALLERQAADLRAALQNLPD
jgi:diadenosine tetraphosphate (Ap4A) HIT family hydrolase